MCDRREGRWRGGEERRGWRGRRRFNEAGVRGSWELDRTGPEKGGDGTVLL